MYKVIVIGGGPGGYVAAIKAAQLGAKVALIEKHKIGGVCLNYGCIPTKTLLRSAKLYEDIMKASSFGIDIEDTSKVSINWQNMMKRKDQVVGQLVGGVEQLLKHNGVTVIKGIANVVDSKNVEVNGQVLACESIILATGSSPFIPGIPGLRESVEHGFAITSMGAIALEDKPKSITILGGGVIAVEFATLYNSLGTEVTVLQRSKNLLKALDEDVQKLITRHLKKSGVKVITGVSIDSVDKNSVTYTSKGKQTSIKSDYILASLGRRANLYGLEHLDLEVSKGKVMTGPHMETNIPSVYAIGDMNGKYMLAHVASAEGIIAAESIMGKKSTIDYNKVPSCIYSFPEVGVVGYSEQDAREAGYDVKTSMFPLSANGKALAEGDNIGFVKIVYDDQYGEVLGVHIVASHATDMIAEAVASLELEATIHDLAKTVHPHPTLSEIVMEAAHGAVDKPIHIFKK